MLGLLFGLIALLIPIVALNKIDSFKKWFGKSWQAMTVLLSLTSCMMAIWFELYFHYQRLLIGDFSAMHDIMPSSVKFGFLLIIVTFVLNAILIFRARKLP